MLQVYSFDLGDHPYARPAALWLSNQFQGSHAWIAWLLQVCYKSITPEMIPYKIVYIPRIIHFGAPQITYTNPQIGECFPMTIMPTLRRLDMTWGDSLATVPDFHRQNPHVK